MDFMSARYPRFAFISALLLLSLSTGIELWAQEQGEEPGSEYPLPIIIGHEPLIFQIRRGTASTDAAERWKKAHTEENIKKLAETGEKMSYTHFYKGFGFQVEKEEMDLAAQTAVWARKYGMVAGVYVQWGTVVLETFLQEDPRSKDWVLRDRDGQPVRIAYGHYYWRYLPDIRNKEYLDWYKEKILRYCIETVKPKYIFLDNVAENPPISWQPLHNSNWINDFRDYLRTRYNPDELKRMIGYSNVDFILPPYWEWSEDKVVNDPIMQRWIDFRCQSVTDAVADVCRYIKKLDPTIAIGVNIHGISRENRAITGIDPVAVCNGTGVDAWGGEIWVEAELTPDGVLISPIREYKACRTLKVAFTSGGGTPLGRAVKLAFSYRHKIPGGGYLGAPGRGSYLAEGQPPPGDTFYKYIDYYRETETVADAAVLRSYPSLAYNSYAPLASTVGFEQALIQAKIPFDIIFEDNLKDLSKYKVLVLANTECMSDRNVELIRNYVRNGGGLVATGSAALYNEWRRPRPGFGLGDVLSLTRKEARETLDSYRISDAVSTWVGAEGIYTRMSNFGHGRAVYVPRVIPAYEGTTVRMNLPVNWPELVEAVKWASGNNLSIKVLAPLTVVINLCQKKEKDQLLLHLVNFKQDLIRNIPVELKVPAGKKVRSITLISTESGGTKPVKFNQEKEGLNFLVPELRLYDLLVIQLG
ncbi:MAG TPA: beta-galactosidase trimerization domain-containing protein [archaeon]|nr:beta-galactosidase trimerization domain-containing protein [archaeon]